MILAGEMVSILFPTRGHYDSCRVSLLRKFKNHKKIYDSLGADSPYDGKFIQCVFDKEQVRGRFQLAEHEERKNNPVAMQFQVEEL